MAKLTPKSPCDGLLPRTIGTVTITEVTPGALTSLSAYQGRDAELSSALKAAHGMEAPKPNRATGKEGARALWFGQGMALLVGSVPDASLANHAALTDQSDAWAVVQLDGQGARDVLARLTPLDLRATVFKRGHTARSDLRHMMSSITCVGDEAYMIMVFRGFAETLVHDLETAMERVASRG